MALEDRVRSSVDVTISDLSTRMADEVRALADHLAAVAAEAEAEAAEAARREALSEAALVTERRVADAEARLRGEIEAAVAAARLEEREAAVEVARREVVADFEAEWEQAQAAAEQRRQEAIDRAEASWRQRLEQSVTVARAHAREAELASAARLLESVRGLDGASTLGEVLDALGQAAAREVPRAAVLVLRDERLLGWRLSGFGPRDAQPKAVDLGLNESGIVGNAATSARAVHTRDGQPGDAPDFARSTNEVPAVAAPVIVSGRVVAVVYADTAFMPGRDHAVPSGWCEGIEILARHAARCLEALAAQKSAAAQATRFWIPGAPKPATAVEAAPGVAT